MSAILVTYLTECECHVSGPAHVWAHWCLFWWPPVQPPSYCSASLVAAHAVIHPLDLIWCHHFFPVTVLLSLSALRIIKLFNCEMSLQKLWNWLNICYFCVTWRFICILTTISSLDLNLSYFDLILMLTHCFCKIPSNIILLLTPSLQRYNKPDILFLLHC
jgi:hypothetical protein